VTSQKSMVTTRRSPWGPLVVRAVSSLVSSSLGMYCSNRVRAGSARAWAELMAAIQAEARLTGQLGAALGATGGHRTSTGHAELGAVRIFSPAAGTFHV